MSNQYQYSLNVYPVMSIYSVLAIFLSMFTRHDQCSFNFLGPGENGEKDVELRLP